MYTLNSTKQCFLIVAILLFPDDYRDMFAKRNSDDFFRLGISISKNLVKLYTDFYQSDIIIASPLGLRLATKIKG